MRLTIKNLIKELDKNKECFMCGDDIEICARGKDRDNMQIKLFCNSCGAQIYLFDLLKEMQNK